MQFRQVVEILLYVVLDARVTILQIVCWQPLSSWLKVLRYEKKMGLINVDKIQTKSKHPYLSRYLQRNYLVKFIGNWCNRSGRSKTNNK